MCGVAGLFSIERPVDAGLVDAVLRMLDAERHRGPSDWGILIPEGALEQPDVRALLESRGLEHVSTYPGRADVPAVILGSRRLSILDLSTSARMPLGSADGRVWIAYNGEVYNFQEIRSELQSKGYTFRTTGDTEVLLHGYVEWGLAVVHRLRGMFAFAVLDAREPGNPQLFLAKDRLGIKPLYWTRQSGLFQFASEVRALLAGGLVSKEPERRGIQNFLVYGSVPAPWTSIRSIYALQPARTLTVNADTYTVPTPVRYWLLPERGSLNISQAEAVRRTRDLIEESVRIHMVSDVPVGVFLSGGLDSTAIAALARTHTDRPLKTVCVAFSDSNLSDGHRAKATADYYKTDHTEIRIDADGFFDALPKFFEAMDQPSADGLNSYLVSRAARQAGLTVALSGLGGDELFWGYPGFRSAPLLGWMARFVPGRSAVGSLAWILRRIQPRFEKLEFLQEHPLLGPYLALRGLFPPAVAARILDTGRLPLPDGLPPVGRLTRGKYALLESDHYLHDQLLRDADAFSMCHSLEVRVPFLDHRLAELAFALPDRILRAGNGEKPLLAAALTSYYPPNFLGRSKMGFSLPFADWLDKKKDAIEQTYLRKAPVAAAPLEDIASRFQSGSLHWSRLWALVVLGGLNGRAILPKEPFARVPADPGKLMLLMPQVYGSPGGIPSYNKALLKSLSEAFPQTELWVQSTNDQYMASEAGAVGRVHFRGLGPRSKPFFKPRYMLAVIWKAFTVRPEAIVACHINFVPLAWFLGRLLGAPVGLIAHGIEVWSPPRYLRTFARKVDVVMPVSRYTASKMSEWGISPSRIARIPNTVDGETYRILRREAANAPSLLTVTRLDSGEKNKGVDRVLTVLPELRKRFPTLVYRVAGSGDDVQRLRRLVRELDLESSVIFCGSVPDGDLPALYNNATVFIMPSTKEGFGIVFLEALACGLPVVAGNRDGSVDPLQDGKVGRLVDPDNSQELVDAIADLLEKKDPALTDPERLRSEALAAFGPNRMRDYAAAAFRKMLGAGRS